MFKKYCRYVVYLFMIAMITIMITNFVRILKAGFHEEQAILNLTAHPDYAFLEAKQAFELCPRDDSYSVMLGNLSEKLYFQTKNQMFLNLATRCYIWAVNMEPQQALNHYLLGIAMLQINQTGFSNAQFEIATKLEPQNPIYLKRGHQ